MSKLSAKDYDEWGFLDGPEKGSADEKKMFRVHGIKEKPKNYYMVTLTTRPNCAEHSKQVEYLENLLSIPRIGDITLYYAYSEETTKKGEPHWHACIVTQAKKRLCNSFFQTWTRNYGNIQVNVQKVGDVGTTLQYIEKSNKPTILRDFL